MKKITTLFASFKPLVFSTSIGLCIVFNSCNILNPPGGNNVQKVEGIYYFNINNNVLKKLSDLSYFFSVAGNYVIESNGKLTAMNTDGTNIHNLLPNDLSTYDYSISPDKSEIAFSTKPNIYVLNINTDKIIKINIPDSIISKQNPSISFDNNKIVFIGDSSIYEINVDGSNLKKLKSKLNGEKEYMNPVFSADDKDIIYETYVGSSGGYFLDLHLFDLTNQNDTAFFNIDKNISPIYEISPQNRFLISFSYGDIYQINLDNLSDIQNNTIGSFANYSLDFSKITYTKPDSGNIIQVIDLSFNKLEEINIKLSNVRNIGISNSILLKGGKSIIFSLDGEILN